MNKTHILFKYAALIIVTVSNFCRVQMISAAPPEGFDFTIPADAPYVPGELLVRFAPKPDGKQRSITEKNQFMISLGGSTIERDFKIVPGLSLVRLPSNMTVKEALKTFNSTDGILHAQPNYLLKACSTFPSDTRFDDLWAMHNTGQTGGTVDADIDALEAWIVPLIWRLYLNHALYYFSHWVVFS